jgi:hypothetical protein
VPGGPGLGPGGLWPGIPCCGGPKVPPDVGRPAILDGGILWPIP